MAVDGLAWLPFQVNLRKGHFSATPSYFRCHGHQPAKCLRRPYDAGR